MTRRPGTGDRNRLTRQRCAGDDGNVGIELPMVVGFLILPVATLVMLLPQWPERQSIATSAAKQAATLYTTAPTAEDGMTLATNAVAQSAGNEGIEMTVAFAGDWCRGCSITAAVTVTIPALVVPFAGTTGAWKWTATSTARIDDFRSISPVTP